jgi:hypothetical protein
MPNVQFQDYTAGGRAAELARDHHPERPVADVTVSDWYSREKMLAKHQGAYTSHVRPVPCPPPTRADHVRIEKHEQPTYRQSHSPSAMAVRSARWQDRGRRCPDASTALGSATSLTPRWPRTPGGRAVEQRPGIAVDRSARICVSDHAGSQEPPSSTLGRLQAPLPMRWRSPVADRPWTYARVTPDRSRSGAFPFAAVTGMSAHTPP